MNVTGADDRHSPTNADGPDRPRICFVGPMLGRHPGWVTTQGEILAKLFERDGWTVRETSGSVNRLVRLLDTVSCLIRWRPGVDVAVVSVFSGSGFFMADVSSLAAKWLRIPVILVLRGGNLPEFGLRYPRWCRRVLGRAQVVVVPSQYLAPFAESVESRLVVVPNVVDHIEHVEPTTGSGEKSLAGKRILWMRTFHPIYNPELAIEAFSRILDEHPDATLTMAGQDKGLRPAMEERAASLGCASVVEFPGFLGPEQKRSAFANHDLYIHTNNVDNTPVSVLEAAAAGVPVVATRVGGIPHLLTDGEDALLVEPGDPVAMARAMSRILNDAELSSHLVAGGRRLAADSSWQSVSDQWLAVFGDAVARRGRSRQVSRAG